MYTEETLPNYTTVIILPTIYSNNKLSHYFRSTIFLLKKSRHHNNYFSNAKRLLQTNRFQKENTYSYF